MDKLYDRQKRSGFFSDFGSIMDFPFYEYNENIDPLFTENSNLKSPLNISVNLQSSMDIHNMENSSDDYFPWSNELKLAINNNNKNYGHLNPDKNAKYEPQNVENGSPQNDNSQTVPCMNQADVSVPNSSSDISNSEAANRYTRKRRIAADEANASNKLQINNHYERTVTSSRDPLALDSDGGKENDMALQNSNKREQNDQGTGGRLQSWHMDDITDNLAADLDGSLSGLGADLSSGSYNMNEALLSLPTLQVFKQEALSPPTSHDVSSANISNIQQNPVSTTACQHATLNQQICPSTTREADSNNNQNGTFQNYLGNEYNSSSSSLPTIISSVSLSPHNHDNYARNTVSSTDNSEDCRFQYVLAAATSIATKVNEDTLTYLNQGQSYEIKLKKLGDLSNYKGKILKSVIGICFHERRMQYGERERLSQWQSGRPGDRVLEVDVPLSYGMSRLQQPTLNTVTFTWDPTVPVGVYIKVNCISTEFTPKKHGGEKGVPFRIQVETYLYEPSQNNGSLGMGRRLHTAACQIKVFKLKGADRKHKQDREKIMKRPLSEQEKYQPSYDCTVLNDLPGDAIYPSLNGFMSTMPPAPITVPSNQCNGYMNSGLAPSTSFVKGEDASISPTVPEAKVSVVDVDNQMYHGGLSADATAEQTVAWLTGNRFSAYATTFASFSGADILRLSRDDLVQICGLADGIRLHNALHAKTIAPKLTLYICTEQTTAFNALYLRACTSSELVSKLALLAGMGSLPSNCFVVGPNGIKVHVTDDVVRNLRDESMYELLCDSNMLLLKPVVGEN